MAISFSSATARVDRATSLNTTIGATAKLSLYSGTVPTDANSALSGNTLLVTLVGSATFGVVANASGVVTLTANAISTVNAVATGTATFGRLFKTDGSTLVLQFTVGTSGTDLVLNSAALTSGGPVSVTSFILTEG